MSHHYIRHNYGDNCYFPDTSFKRYNRYNDSHGDTLIFNYNNGGYCGGGFGICAGNTFLSGLGAGLANGLMGLFGGFMSGFGNMFGFGGLGMMGMPMFGINGSLSGIPSYTNTTGNSTDSTSGNTSKTSHNGSCTDADETNAHTLINKLKKLEVAKNPSDDEVRKLYNQVKSYYENPLDDAHKSGNKDTYGLLLNSIEKLAKEKNIDLNKAPEEKTSAKAPEENSTAAAASDQTAETPAQKTGTEQAGAANTAEGKQAANEDSENDKLKADVASINAKSDAEVKAMPASDRKNLISKLNNKTDETSKAARVKLKNSFYKDGNKNVEISELDDEETRNNIAKAFANIIDTSKIADINGVTNTTITKGADGKYKLECTYKGKPLTYGYVEENDGELIFHGMQMKGDTQHYVLQKTSSGKYELMQYDYHKGHGTADYTK